MSIKKKIFTSFLITVCAATVMSSCGKTVEDETESNSVSQTQASTVNETSQTTIPPTTEVTTVEVTTIEISSLKNTDLDRICKKYGATGVQAAFISEGKVVSTYEYGIANKPDTEVKADTKYRVASLSKLVTNMVFMAMSDEGLVDDSADISDYFGFSVRNPSYSDTVITAEQLMTHLSSICDSSAFLTSRQNHSSTSIRTLLQSGSSFYGYKPGTNYNYCNFNNAIVGAICETVSGKCFEELAEKYLFGPLHIDAAYLASDIDDKSLIGELYNNGGYSLSQQLSESFCKTPGQTHHIVQGNLTISAEDYARIICVLLNDGKTEDGQQLLSKKSVDKIISANHCGKTNSEGYGLWFSDELIDGTNMAMHTGSNFGMFSAFAFDKETKSGAVVLTSGADGSKSNGAEVYDICYNIIRAVYPG